VIKYILFGIQDGLRIAGDIPHSPYHLSKPFPGTASEEFSVIHP
jgi:hypothetical protein